MTELPPRRAQLAPLLAVLVLLECGLALAAEAAYAQVRSTVAAGGWPGWLVGNSLPVQVGDVALAETGLALTGVVRLLQIALVWRWVRHAGLGPQVGIHFAWTRRALVVALGGLAFTAAGAAALEVAFRLFGQGSFIRDVLVGDPDPSLGAWPLFVLALAVQGVIGPLAEEIVCRGLIYVPLRRSRGVLVGVLVSAGIFALLHRPEEFLPFLLWITGGVLFAAACELGRGLAAPFLFHALYNAMIVVAHHPALR